MNDKSPLDAALNQRSSWMHVSAAASDKSVPTGRLAQAASKSMQRCTVNTREGR